GGRGPRVARSVGGQAERFGGTRWAITAIDGVRRRMPAAALTAARARGAAADLFGPRRARRRTVAALPCRPGWCPSPDARARTAWPLRSGSRQTPPSPGASVGGRARYRRRSSKTRLTLLAQPLERRYHLAEHLSDA